MIRSTQTIPDGGMVITAPTALDSTEYHAFSGDGVNGRGLVYVNTPAMVFGCSIVHGNDDALCLVGDCRGSLIADTSFPVVNWKPGAAHAVIAYTSQDSNQPGVIIGAANGFAGTFHRCAFDGGAVRIKDGVWTFIGCEFVISHLYGLELMDAAVNLIEPRFRTIPMPPDAGHWGSGIPIRVTGLKDGKQVAASKSRVFISNPTLDGKPVQAAKLVYKLDGKTPATAALRSSFITR